MTDSSPLSYLTIPPHFVHPPPKFIKPNSYKHTISNHSNHGNNTNNGQKDKVEEIIDLKASFSTISKNWVKAKLFELAYKIHNHYIPAQNSEISKAQQLLSVDMKIKGRNHHLSELVALSQREDFDITIGATNGFIHSIYQILFDSNESMEEVVENDLDEKFEDNQSNNQTFNIELNNGFISRLNKNEPEKRFSNGLNDTNIIKKIIDKYNSYLNDYNLIDIGVTETTIGFILSQMHLDLKKINNENVAKIIFQYGNSHKYFQFYYEITERVLNSLIVLKHVVSRSWNRMLLASQDTILVLNMAISFTLYSINCLNLYDVANIEFRDRITDIWLGKILFILKFISADILFEIMDQKIIKSLLHNLELIYFLENKFGKLSLAVLEILNLLTTSIRDGTHNIQEYMKENYEDDIELNDSQSQRPCYYVYIHPHQEISLLELQHKIHIHNISYFQFAFKDLFQTFSRVLIPSHQIDNQLLLMCRANILYLTKKIANTDLLTLEFKENFTNATHLLTYLISLMPVQASPSIYVEDREDDILPLERTSFKNEEDLQKCCADIIVGLSETISGIKQLKENQDKISMICMISNEEISELMSNCLFVRNEENDVNMEPITDEPIESTLSCV